MASTNFNMRLDDDLKDRVYPILETYGLTPSQAVKLFFNQIAETGKVPLSFDWADKQPTAKLLKAIEELENGETTTYQNVDDLVKAFSNTKN